MSHYALDEWAEFALGGGAPERRKALQEHLDGGCVECAKTVATWTRVREMAAQEDAFLPPGSAIHFARTLYRALPPQTRENPLIEWCRLIFDSRRQPALAGIRGGAAAPSRFLFRGGSLVVDVVMEPRADDQPISLVGQISEPGNPAGRYENLSISVVRDAGEVTRTTTNQSGEFQMLCKPSRSLLLLVELRNQSVLVSPLPVGSPNHIS